MSFEDLVTQALNSTKTLQDHPNWAAFKERIIPASISFYYTNQQQDEAYWEHMRIIKLDLRRMQLLLEGVHGDPLRFDIFKITHCKNAKTGEKVQDIWFDLMAMWQEIYTPSH